MTADLGSPFCALCDWGTSTFRIWLVDETGGPLAQYRSSDGMLRASAVGFEAVLEQALASMGAPGDLPVIACGMVGAKQGWVEVPYVRLPVQAASLLAGIVRVSSSKRVVHIVPGVMQTRPQADVMRGEETQLSALLEDFGGSYRVVLPGTHSKWAVVEDNKLRSFTTFMTGELFALLSSASILKHSLAGASIVSHEHRAFEEGVRSMVASPHLLSRLFTIRAATLVAGLDTEAALARLSGLLIGAELAEAGTGNHDRIILVASGAMRPLYERAMMLAGMTATTVDAELMVRKGLWAIARRLFPAREVSTS